MPFFEIKFISSMDTKISIGLTAICSSGSKSETLADDVDAGDVDFEMHRYSYNESLKLSEWVKA